VSQIAPEAKRGEVDESKKVSARLFVASGEMAEAFECVEEFFDERAERIEFFVFWEGFESSGLRVDDGLKSPVFAQAYKPVRVVASMSDRSLPTA